MRVVFAVVLSLFAVIGFSQDQSSEAKEKTGRPNIPGTMQVDFGYSFLPGEEYFSVIGSRTLNLYYYRDIKLGASKFSFHPGIGFGLDRYKFSDSTNNRSTYVIVNTSDSSYFLADQARNIRKSMLIANYIDIPVEFRFNTNPSDPTRSFMVALGGKVGYLFRGASKLKYEEDGQTKKLKDIQNFHLSDLRYGAYLRVGTGGFNVFYNYMISPLFKSGEGHEKRDLTTMTVGISFVGF